MKKYVRAFQRKITVVENKIHIKALLKLFGQIPKIKFRKSFESTKNNQFTNEMALNITSLFFNVVWKNNNIFSHAFLMNLKDFCSDTKKILDNIILKDIFHKTTVLFF